MSTTTMITSASQSACTKRIIPSCSLYFGMSTPGVSE